MGGTRVLLIAAVALALLQAGPAFATPAVNGIFDIPGDAGVQTNGQLTVGPDGNIWVALDTAIAKVQPDGTVTVFASADLNNTLGFPAGGITSAGGFIWVSQGTGGGKKAIVKIPPAAPGTAEGVDVTGIDAGATAMTLGPDGNVWVALNNGVAGKIVRFSPADPSVSTTFPMGTLSPRGITSASDNTLWVTDTANSGRLLNVTTGGVATPYTVGGQPQFVGAGPGGLIAYGNPNNSPQQIGLLKPGGTPQTIDRPNGSDPFGVTFGADGAFWVAEFAGNRLARVTTDGQLTTLSDFPVVAGQGPRQIVAGPNNTLWVTLDKPGFPADTKIARVTGVDPAVVTPPVENPPPETPPVTEPITTPAPDTTAPVVSAVKLVRTSRAVSLRFALSEPGQAKLTLSRRLAGKRRGKACVKPTPRLRRAKRCTRLVHVRTIALSAKAGANAIQIKLARLAAGSYTAVLSVSDAAGNKAAPVARTFKVTKKRRGG